DVHCPELPVTPRLVADAPELHTVGLRMTVLGTQLTHRRGNVAVDVFHELRRRPGVAEARVDRDVRIGAEQTAQRQKLVRADVVRLHCLPDGIVDRRSLVARTDRVTPLVRRDEVPSRETI